MQSLLYQPLLFIVGYRSCIPTVSRYQRCCSFDALFLYLQWHNAGFLIVSRETIAKARRTQINFNVTFLSLQLEFNA